MKNLALSVIFSIAVAFASFASVNSGLNLPGEKKSKKGCKTEQKDCKKGEKKSCCPSKNEGDKKCDSKKAE